MTTRILAVGTWKSTSALHCGSSTESRLSGLDMVLTRDFEGTPFIPAASLIGTARAFAGRYLMPSTDYEVSDMGDREVYTEPPELRALFGSRAEYASTVSASDAALLKRMHPTVRDGVRIDPRTGLAWQDDEGGAKYDCEVLPAGASFGLSFEVRVPDPLPNGVTEQALLAVFGVVLRGFETGDIRLGARTHRGYGAGKVHNWSIRRIRTAGHYAAWLKRDADAGEPLSLADLGQAPPDCRSIFRIGARFVLQTSLLVRSGGSKAKDPDTVHLTESESAVVPGTSLAGVLRHRCERIANTLAPNQAKALVDGMFGPHKDEEHGALRASRVEIDEVEVEDTTVQVQTRVAIDRFTQGSLETALFDEAALWPSASSEGHVRELHIRLAPPRHDECKVAFEQEAGLLLMAFKDLWLGDLPIGGGAAGGRGVLKGLKAVFEHPDFGERLEMEAKPPKVGAIQRSGPEEGWRKIEEWCRSWHKERPQ